MLKVFAKCAAQFWQKDPGKQHRLAYSTVFFSYKQKKKIVQMLNLYWSGRTFLDDLENTLICFECQLLSWPKQKISTPHKSQNFKFAGIHTNGLLAKITVKSVNSLLTAVKTATATLQKALPTCGVIDTAVGLTGGEQITPLVRGQMLVLSQHH